LPNEFAASGLELKPLAYFEEIESGSSFTVTLVDSSGQEHPLDPTGWTKFTGDDSGDMILRVTYYPAYSTSEVTRTAPGGIVLLKR